MPIHIVQYAPKNPTEDNAEKITEAKGTHAHYMDLLNGETQGNEQTSVQTTEKTIWAIDGLLFGP